MTSPLNFRASSMASCDFFEPVDPPTTRIVGLETVVFGGESTAAALVALAVASIEEEEEEENRRKEKEAAAGRGS